MKLIRIIKAKLRNKKKLEKEQWYNERIKICNNCEYNSLLNLKRGFKYWLFDILNFKKPFCTECGCELKAKTSEKIEECPHKYWKSIEN